MNCAKTKPEARNDSLGLPARFWEKVQKGANDGSCWEWIGAVSGEGSHYGSYAVYGRRVGAHRVALEAKLGRPIRDGMVCMHVCDNRTCVNPDHLQEATPSQNSRDTAAKGRRNPRPRFVLTEDDVHRIRAARGTQAQIARRFGISRSHVGAIRRYERWVDVEVCL